MANDEKDRGKKEKDGSEWRTSLTIDYCPSNIEESGENETHLIFSLFLDSHDCIIPILDMEYHVDEVGVEEKHTFNLSKPGNLFHLFLLEADSWNLSKHAITNAAPLLNQIIAFRIHHLANPIFKWS